jgi:hypothetical protein
MSMNTWSQYVSMDEPMLEMARVEASLATLDGWDDDFEIGEPWVSDEDADEDFE